ncbi:hypothetical protein GFL80_32740 [Rhizobium leguminosarum bv. viciae]|nr:hypothetical protein [Rhizobium leguminosarum bv. viciae]
MSDEVIIRELVGLDQTMTIFPRPPQLGRKCHHWRKAGRTEELPALCWRRFYGRMNRLRDAGAPLPSAAARARGP